MPFNKYDSLVEVQAFFLRVGDRINYGAIKNDYTWFKSLCETCDALLPIGSEMTYDTDIMTEANVGFKFRAIGEGIDTDISCGLDYELQESGVDNTLGRCLEFFKELAEKKLEEYKAKVRENWIPTPEVPYIDDDTRVVRFITVWTYNADERGTSYDLVGLLNMDTTLESAMTLIPPIRF